MNTLNLAKSPNDVSHGSSAVLMVPGTIPNNALLNNPLFELTLSSSFPSFSFPVFIGLSPSKWGQILRVGLRLIQLFR